MEHALANDLYVPLLTLLMTHDERETYGVRIRIIENIIQAKLNQYEQKNALGIGIGTIICDSNALDINSLRIKNLAGILVVAPT